MNGTIAALLFGVGAAAWVFSILVRRVGSGNEKQAAIGAAAAFVAAFVVFYTLFVWVFNF